MTSCVNFRTNVASPSTACSLLYINVADSLERRQTTRTTPGTSLPSRKKDVERDEKFGKGGRNSRNRSLMAALSTPGVATAGRS